MNAALYIRVSTEDQIELSPDSQKKLLLEYAQKNNLDVEDEHIFMDEGISGRKAEKRPAFMQMIALAKSKNKPFEKILVWKFSRFARNQEESIVYKNMLRKDGVEVISVSEPIIDGPFGSLIERIIEWMDEYYSIRLSSEVTRGMKEKAMRGGVQSSPVLGYDIADNQYVLNEKEAEIVKKAFNLFIQGDTCGVIAKYFNSLGYKNKRGNLFTGRVIKYMIQNPIYYGMVRWNYATQQGVGRKVNPEEDWIIVKGKHIPIIDKETWDKANNKISTAKPTTYTPSTGYKHWLGGLLRCKHCGGTLVYGETRTKRNGKLYISPKYSCNNYIKGKCSHSNSISVKKIETEIIALLESTSKKLSEEGSIQELNIRIQDSNNKQEILNKQLEKLDKRLLKAKEAFLAEVDTLEEYKSNKEIIEKERMRITEQLNKLEEPKQVSGELKNRCTTAIKIIQDDSASIEYKNKFLKDFIDSITFSKMDDELVLLMFYNSSIL